MRDIREAPEVSLESLMHATLPALPPDELNSVCERLIFNGSITNSNQNPRWKCLPHDPNNALSEAWRFKFLEEIVLAVAESHSKSFISDLKFQVSEESILFSIRDDSSRPDGFFYLRKRQRKPSKFSWTDMVMPMEFNRIDDACDRCDNFDKVMWSMHYLLRNDARRRFVHGLTCENTKARLWYHDRCDAIGSEEFDINMDWRHLVRIILSMLLAPPDRLGFDPDIELLPLPDPDAEANYNITIHNSDTKEATTYRTLEIISNYETDDITGPGTRVWIVRKLVDGNPDDPCYVLKDTWIHEDCVAEHVLLKEIREAHPSYAQYFLTPHDHGFAYFSVAALDNTHKTLRRTELIPTNKVLPGPSDTPGRHSVGGPGEVPRLDRRYRHLNKQPRQHYRIVFEEIGKRVHDLRIYADVFTAIQGGWEGLYAMFLCGYVHRNIGSGNILLVPASNGLSVRGVITNLEHAKRIDDTSSPHDDSTDTAAFRAIEVAYMTHKQFIPESPGTVDSSWDAQSKNGLSPVPPFQHNPLHDMESIWWLCMWIMFYLLPAGQSSRAQAEGYHQVFHSTITRDKFFSCPIRFQRSTESLSKVQPFLSLMTRWSIMLNTLYKEAYMKQAASSTHLKMIRIDEKTVKASYDHGKTVLKQLQETSKSFSTIFVSLVQQSRDEYAAEATEQDGVEL